MKFLDRLFNWFLFIVSFIFGLALILYSLNYAVLTIKSETWLETTGQIVYSNINISGKHNHIHTPKIVYRYSVNEVNYAGQEITFAYSSFPYGDSKEFAEEKLKLYPKDAQIKVFYYPDDPRYSCLEKGGVVVGYLIPVSFGILLTIFGLYGGFRFFKTQKGIV